MDEEIALEVARIERMALEAIRLRMAAEQVGEAFRAFNPALTTPDGFDCAIEMAELCDGHRNGAQP